MARVKLLKRFKFSKRFLASPLMRRRLLPLATLLTALGLAVLLVVTRTPMMPKPPQEVVWSIKTVPVLWSKIRPNIRVFGEVVGSGTVDLRALVAGEVMKTYPMLEEGGVVRKGEKLLKIDPFNYLLMVRESEASLTEAMARHTESRARYKQERSTVKLALQQLELKKSDLMRSLLLKKEGIVAQKFVDDRKIIVNQQAQVVEASRANVAARKAGLDRQKAAIERAEAGVSRAKKQLADTLLTAPFDAFVSNVSTQKGRLMNVNDKVATLTDSTKLEVRFNISNDQFGRLLAAKENLRNRDLRVLWKVGEETVEFPAIVERLGPRVKKGVGGMDIFGRLDINATETSLRPGAFVEIIMKDRLYENVSKLPRASLFGKDIIYLVVDGYLQPHRVKVEGYYDDFILVSSSTLQQNSRVMITRLPEAGEGLRVKVVR